MASVAAQDKSTAVVGGLLNSVSTFSSNDIFAVSRFDGNKQMQLFRITAPDGTHGLVAEYDCGLPLFDSAVSSDMQHLFGARADGHLVDLAPATGQAQFNSQLHEHPISCIKWSSPVNALVTGSWDHHVKFHDVRTNQVAQDIELEERVYAMDAYDNYVAVGLAGRVMNVYDVRRLPNSILSEVSTLAYLTTSIAIFSKVPTGFCAGTVGRIAVRHFDGNAKTNFAFKAHRVVPKNGPQALYPINSISFNAKGTFATGGGDGNYAFWDKDSKTKLCEGKTTNDDFPISAAEFTNDVKFYVYTKAYDWSKGKAAYETFRTKAAQVCVHKVQAHEVNPRPKAKK